jgi:hypothetical protein
MAEEVQTIQAGGPAVALTSSPAVGAGPLEKVYAFWLAGMSCGGGRSQHAYPRRIREARAL